MLLTLLESALEFDTDYSYKPGDDVEEQAMYSEAGQNLLERTKLETIFQGIRCLPFEATRSLRHLLDYLSRFEHDNDCCWYAMLLRMGLFLTNMQGRLAWYVAVSSILYSWELVVKFRVPTRTGHNIYYAETPTLATCFTE